MPPTRQHRHPGPKLAPPAPSQPPTTRPPPRGGLIDPFDDFNEENAWAPQRLRQGRTIIIFGCWGYTEMCQLALGNLQAMGIGHLAIATDEKVCDTLGYDDTCCTVADDVIGAGMMGPADAEYTVRWQYLEIALGFGYDVIMQDCDVLWTRNPLADFRSDPEKGIIGLREESTAFPFNAGLTWFRANRTAVTRLVRDVNERVDFFAHAKDDPDRLEDIGIDKVKCTDGNKYQRLYFDQSIYNDALESSALNDDVYTRSRIVCDKRVYFLCVPGFKDTGCLVLQPGYGAGDGFVDFKSRNGKEVACHEGESAPAVSDAPAPAASAAPAAEEEEKKPEPAAKEGGSDNNGGGGGGSRRRPRRRRRRLLADPAALRDYRIKRRRSLLLNRRRRRPVGRVLPGEAVEGVHRPQRRSR